MGDEKEKRESVKSFYERAISDFQKEPFESVLNQAVKLLFHRGQRFARIMSQHQIARLRRL